MSRASFQRHSAHRHRHKKRAECRRRRKPATRPHAFAKRSEIRCCAFRPITPFDWRDQQCENYPKLWRYIGSSGQSYHFHTVDRSEEHTSELQSLRHLVCRLLLEKKKKKNKQCKTKTQSYK